MAISYSEAVEGITKILQPHCLFVFLLGSFGTERFSEDSDIDLAGYFQEPLTWELRMKLTQLLSQLLLREIDLVDLKKIDPIFGKQVVETGKVIFSKSAGQLLAWKMQILSVYPDFKKSREVIEKNLLRRKKNV
jgi:predicted nucleotidyltransferase